MARIITRSTTAFSVFSPGKKLAFPGKRFFDSPGKNLGVPGEEIDGNSVDICTILVSSVVESGYS